MKVRVYPLTDSNPEYYFEYYFTPEYGTDGRLGGYRYSNKEGYKGWYGSEIFKRDLHNRIVKIIEDITPKKEIKKLSLV